MPWKNSQNGLNNYEIPTATKGMQLKRHAQGSTNRTFWEGWKEEVDLPQDDR